MAATSFFGKPQVKQGVEKRYVNTGLGQFHALTIALFDYFKAGHRVSEASLKIILERFYSVNPKLISTDLYRTVQQRMQMLINNNPKRTEVIESVAYLLRQIAVDEILANPLNYRAAFLDMTPETPTNVLRQHTSILPATVFAAACAKALRITLTLIRTEHNKELGAQEIHDFNPAGKANFNVIIQVQGDNYFPQVHDKTIYLPTFAKVSSSSEPDAITTMEPILKKIEADNQRILHAYQQMRKRLFTMLAAGELSKDYLLDLYIQLLPQTNQLNMNRTEFFAQLEQLDKNPVNPEPALGTEEGFIRQLVDTLSGLMSIDQINANKFFNSSEEVLEEVIIAPGLG